MIIIIKTLKYYLFQIIIINYNYIKFLETYYNKYWILSFAKLFITSLKQWLLKCTFVFFLNNENINMTGLHFYFIYNILIYYILYII